MGCSQSRSERLEKAKKKMTEMMPEQAEEAVKFTNSELNPYAVELSKVWKPGAVPKRFENGFVTFDYPPEQWDAKNESALEAKTETQLGVNIRLSVELLDAPMDSRSYCDFVNEQVATILLGVRYHNDEFRTLRNGQQLACVHREWEMPTPVKGVQVKIPLKQLSLHGTTIDEKTGECVAYNCTISSGNGIWELFNPIFERFLNNLEFKPKEEVAALCRREMALYQQQQQQQQQGSAPANDKPSDKQEAEPVKQKIETNENQ